MASLYKTTNGTYESLAEFGKPFKAQFKARLMKQGARLGKGKISPPAMGTKGGRKGKNMNAPGATGGGKKAKRMYGNWVGKGKVMKGHTSHNSSMTHTGKTGAQPLHAKGVNFGSKGKSPQRLKKKGMSKYRVNKILRAQEIGDVGYRYSAKRGRY